jgi:thiamine-phosphate pyrophosphorylase
MRRRQPLPRLWLMTDERQGETLWDALERLPRGAGVIFRHYGLPATERRALFARVRRICIRKRLLLVAAGNEKQARAWRANGWHGRERRPSRLFRTTPAHNVRELRVAERSGAALAFLSPVFPTRSHPDARTLGRIRFGLIARVSRIPLIALGGMDARRARHVPGAYGWAAIDAWSAGPAQKRKAVPR